MEQGPAVVLTYLPRAGLALVLALTFSATAVEGVSRAPQIIGCVFQERANVTCRWEPGDLPAMNYTLKVKRRPTIIRPWNSPLNIFTCTTSDTSCTVVTNSSARFTFCITVMAHGHGWSVMSHQRCQSGRKELMLPPVTLTDIEPVRGRPRCLNITWSCKFDEFPVSETEIRKGNLKSQIEITTQGQHVQVKDVTVGDHSFLVCHLRPDTSYTIRLRHRYLSPESPWSPWSNAWHRRTGEDAPSAEPAFWRRVTQADKNSFRLISLFWKPLPHILANGRVLFFNVTCRSQSGRALTDLGSCRDLCSENTSCSLWLPPVRCSCALTASTSAGTSPEARIWLPGAAETEPSPPRQISVSPLGDKSLDVRWMAPANGSADGFIVEWFAVRETNSSVLHWERLNSSCTSLVITEGVELMERYAVSVNALYGERGAGREEAKRIYTRQGTPSAGPMVHVEQISGNTVALVWSPVPVEQLHGFIRHYIVSYTRENQPAKRVIVPGHVHHHYLKDLLPGNYRIFVQATTKAGDGAAGPRADVHINEASDDISLLMATLLPLLLTSLVLILIACLAHCKMVKWKVCTDIPDPSHSSLAHWSPKITSESMKRPTEAENTAIKCRDVNLLGENELQNSSSYSDLACHDVDIFQTSSLCYSTLPASGAQTPPDATTPTA